MPPITEQFIGLGAPITEDTPLYRVFSSYRLRELLVSKKLALVAPELWDDPFENFLARAKATVDGLPNVSIGGLFKNFYAQCRTLNPESDAMWRIYSPTKDEARVRSSHAPRSSTCFAPSRMEAIFEGFSNCDGHG